MADNDSKKSPLAMISLAPVAGLLFIVGSLTLLIFANIWAKYPLFHPLVGTDGAMLLIILTSRPFTMFMARKLLKPLKPS